MSILHACSILLRDLKCIQELTWLPFSPQLTPSSFLRIGQLSNVDLNEDIHELVSGTERGPLLLRPLPFLQ